MIRRFSNSPTPSAPVGFANRWSSPKMGTLSRGIAAMQQQKLAGLTEIPCRVLNITSKDPEFLHLLVEYKKHRIKSADELLREAVVNINPEQAHQRLIEHRRE